MSLQALLLNAYTRRFVKAASARLPVDDLITMINKVADRRRPMPGHIALEPLEIDGVPAEWIDARGGARDKVVLYTHGGGYCTLTSRAFRHLSWRIAEQTGARVLAYDYRLAPEHPHPAALDDAITVYSWLLAQDVAPSDIVLLGDSAGGGLTMALLIALRDRGVALPGRGGADLALGRPDARDPRDAPQHRA